MMSRPNRFTYVPITRGHKPTASQESNTFSTTSETSCYTTLSVDSEADQADKEADARLEELEDVEVEDRGVYRSESEETVDTVVTVAVNRNLEAGERDKRMKSRNSDYGSLCGSPSAPGRSSSRRDDQTDVGGHESSPGSAPLLPSSDSEDEKDLEGGFHPSLHGSIKLDMPPPSSNKSIRIPGEPLKTLLSALFLGSGFLATTTSLAFTHERVPDIKPLPDLVLDHIKYQPWGLSVSEVLLMVNTMTAVVIILFHSHRSIILRRIWLILGLLYYARALTMMVTVLPKADEEYECMPRKNDTSAEMYLKRVLTIISGGGLSINGKHVFCGDYIFSGHTMTLTLGYLAIIQYSPKRFVLLHWASLLAAICGVIFLLLSRGHYSIDVLVAYWASSRLWWVYHTLAHNENLKSRGPHNLLSNMIWWHVFRFFENKVSGPLPQKYSVPLPRRFKRWAVRSWRHFKSRVQRGVSGIHSASNEDLQH